MRILIRDNQSREKTVKEYGTDQHDALMISEDGRCLYYENLQNGDGSMFAGYTFVLEDGKPPQESNSDEAYYGQAYANIGGFGDREEARKLSKRFCDKVIVDAEIQMFKAEENEHTKGWRDCVEYFRNHIKEMFGESENE